MRATWYRLTRFLSAAAIGWLLASSAALAAEQAAPPSSDLLGEVIEVPEVGRFAHLKDAQGAVFAIIKPAA